MIPNICIKLRFSILFSKGQFIQFLTRPWHQVSTRSLVSQWVTDMGRLWSDLGPIKIFNNIFCRTPGNIDSDSNRKVPKIGNGPFSEQWHRCLFSLYLIDFSFYIYFTSIQCTSIAKGLTVVQALGSRVDRSPLIGWFLLRLSDFSLVGNITDHGRILYQTKR